MEQKRINLNSSSIKHVRYCGTDEITCGLSELSKSSVKFSVDENNSEISIATSILDVDESTRKEIDDYEEKLHLLEAENLKFSEELQNERKKTEILEKKLQFVKDNQEVFMRLKEAYINMKYNEAAGRKMIQIREKSIQTWEGTLCSACIETEELRRQINIMMQKYRELFVVSPGEMEHLLNTIKYLKDLINRREETWGFNMDREYKFQSRIAILEGENVRLKDAICKLSDKIPEEIVKDVKLDQKLIEERKIEEMQKFIEGLSKELERCKKIIIKYERKFREFKEYAPNKTAGSPLNEKELKMVHQIIHKYNAKIQKKTEELHSRSSSVEPGRSPLNRRPSSPLRSSRDSSCKRDHKKPQNPPPRDESAILMMDKLFD